jgi:hypothetical protein
MTKHLIAPQPQHVLTFADSSLRIVELPFHDQIRGKLDPGPQFLRRGKDMDDFPAVENGFGVHGLGLVELESLQVPEEGFVQKRSLGIGLEITEKGVEGLVAPCWTPAAECHADCASSVWVVRLANKRNERGDCGPVLDGGFEEFRLTRWCFDAVLDGLAARGIDRTLPWRIGSEQPREGRAFVA